VDRTLDSTGGRGSGDGVVITAQAVKNYITHLATQRRVAAATQNQAFKALLILCRDVLRMAADDLDTGVRAKRGKHPPVVLSCPEVAAMLQSMDDTPRLMAELIYGGGLRVMECCRLRIKDVDFDSHLVFVRAAEEFAVITLRIPLLFISFGRMWHSAGALGRLRDLRSNTRLVPRTTRRIRRRSGSGTGRTSSTLWFDPSLNGHVCRNDFFNK